MKPLCRVASEAKRSSQVSRTQEDGRQCEGRTQARGQGKGQGLSSEGIHTEDVETDIVGGQSFLHFSHWVATKTRRAQRDTHTNDPKVLMIEHMCSSKCVTVKEEIMTDITCSLNTALQCLCLQCLKINSGDRTKEQ